jgi:SH3-like domain-containing protein
MRRGKLDKIKGMSLLIFLGLAVAQADDGPTCLAAEILKNDVNLRAKPATSAPSVARVSRGVRLPVEAVPQSEEWARVTQGDYAGRFISLSVARVVLQAELAGCREATASAEAAGTQINVRAEPSTTAAIAGKLSPGDALTVGAATGPWLKITWPEDQAGRYVHRDFVRLRLPMTE